MKSYGLNELRKKYLEFFESKGHLALPSFSLVPENDKSLLLINAGMAPLKPYFTGQEIPPRTRVTTCQKCIRTGAKPEFSYEIMRELRKALADDIHLEKYAAVGAEMLHELHLAILDKQNIMPYIKAGYIPEQLTEIRHAMKQGCNIDPYLNTGFRGAAIRELVEGLEAGLDVSIYAKLDYSW